LVHGCNGGREGNKGASVQILRRGTEKQEIVVEATQDRLDGVALGAREREKSKASVGKKINPDGELSTKKKRKEGG